MYKNPVSPIFSSTFVFSFLLLILLLFFFLFFLAFIFDNSRPNGCEVVSSHCSLICFSLMISDTEHLFMCLLAIYIVFRKMWGSWCISKFFFLAFLLLSFKIFFFVTLIKIWYEHLISICFYTFVSFKIISLAFSGEGNGTPLQYSYLENLMDRGAW